MWYLETDMAHPVVIKTPMPTWEETAAHYGLSKADRKFVASLFNDKKLRREPVYAPATPAPSSRRANWEKRAARKKRHFRVERPVEYTALKVA
jgi:hypothetical protein